MRISTHTLTWSVTFNKRYSTLSNHISTHTLTWSVTLSECLNAGEEVISTHTLTWSVTCWQGEDNPCTVHFNSHAHVERDLHMNSFNVNMSISTHTLTWSVTFIGSYSGFKLTISTHTLTWSVTVNTTLPVTNSQISTHTLTWSVTLIVTNVYQFQWFQLTRSRGAWRVAPQILLPCLHFNSHAHVERDKQKRKPLI